MINGVVVFCIIAFILAVLFIKNVYELFFAIAIVFAAGCVVLNSTPTELITLIKDSWAPLLQYISNYIDKQVG